MIGSIVLFIFAVLIPLAILLGVDYLLYFNEIAVYRLLSYKWVIALYIIAAIILAIIYIGTIRKDNHRAIGVLGLVLTVIATGTMIFSVAVSKPVQTYSVNSASDFKVLFNVAKINNYRILIKQDIDFGGEELSFGGTFENDIKGGGHTLSNFKVKNGLFNTIKGNISGITFKDVLVEYYVYYEDKNKGRTIGESVLCLFSEGTFTDINSENVEINYVNDNSSGCGCTGDSWALWVVLFWVAIGVGAFIMKVKEG